VSLPHEAVEHLQRVLREPEPPGGRYVIRDLLGEGGMGSVYRAYDRALDREVALKVLRRDVSGTEAAARLDHEARILAHLEHPGIVPVHAVGILADGRVFYVMKLVHGEDLEAFARRATLTETLRLFLRICETVGFAHASDVVHRDLKPSNIMVGAFGEVLVLDWGIARWVRDATEPTSESARPERSGDTAGFDAPDLGLAEPNTAPGTVLGTAGFMAPEQAQGWLHLVDARSDVYALGAVLRTIATRNHADSPGALTAIWTQAMAAEPERRYASAVELAAEITRFLDGQPVAAHRETLAERVGRVFRKYQTAIVLILTYLTIRLLFLVTRGF
jgi:eukaryotic-like serine/threonine-protein kinase